MPRAVRRATDSRAGCRAQGAARRKSVRGSQRAAERHARMALGAAHHSASHAGAERLFELPRTARTVRPADTASGTAILPAMSRAGGGIGSTSVSIGWPHAMSSALNRRDLFAMFARPFQRTPSAVATQPTDVVAVIQGRRCIALTSFCAACVERCPVSGAMTVSNGMPSVAPDLCTGCGICHEVCPAPTNAVLLLPRRRTSSQTAVPPIHV